MQFVNHKLHVQTQLAAILAQVESRLGFSSPTHPHLALLRLRLRKKDGNVTNVQYALARTGSLTSLTRPQLVKLMVVFITSLVRAPRFVVLLCYMAKKPSALSVRFLVRVVCSVQVKNGQGPRWAHGGEPCSPAYQRRIKK